MRGEAGNCGEGEGAFGTVPLPPVVLYFVIIPIMAVIKKSVWLGTGFECTDIRSEISKHMPALYMINILVAD